MKKMPSCSIAKIHSTFRRFMKKQLSDTSQRKS